MATKTVSNKKTTTKKNLVIVESPAKAKTIEKYLGKNYKVVASVGHIRDLKKSSMSIDFDNNYAPEYINIRGKGPLINSLKKKQKMLSKSFSRVTRTAKEKQFLGIWLTFWDWTQTIKTVLSLMKLQEMQ